MDNTAVAVVDIPAPVAKTKLTLLKERLAQVNAVADPKKVEFKVVSGKVVTHEGPSFRSYRLHVGISIPAAFCSVALIEAAGRLHIRPSFLIEEKNGVKDRYSVNIWEGTPSDLKTQGLYFGVPASKSMLRVLAVYEEALADKVCVAELQAAGLVYTRGGQTCLAFPLSEAGEVHDLTLLSSYDKETSKVVFDVTKDNWSFEGNLVMVVDQKGQRNRVEGRPYQELGRAVAQAICDQAYALAGSPALTGKPQVQKADRLSTMEKYLAAKTAAQDGAQATGPSAPAAAESVETSDVDTLSI